LPAPKNIGAKPCPRAAKSPACQRLLKPGWIKPSLKTLSAKGFSISKSALHRYGQDFESKLSALRVASEQARAVVAAAPDEEGAVNEALMRLVQEHLFKLLMADDDKMDLPKVAKAVAELGKASIAQKKWQAEYREKAEAAASRVEKIAKKGGLNQATVEEIRREILGMVA
jgi:hypothetical protein